MKASFFAFLVAAAAGLAADNPPITGKWQVHSSVSGTEFDQVCTFSQKDDALSGSCAGEQGTVQITGQVSGNKITWSYKTEYNGTPLTVKYSGSLDSAANKMMGSVDVPEFSAGGDFTATQAK